MASKEFIYNEFKRFGLETFYHNFNNTGISTVSVSGFILSLACDREYF
jgi:hypothetical protein